MTAIASVTVRRFKRLELVTLHPKEVTLLIGANNSGKSSILQALHFAVSLAQSAKLVGEGVSWRANMFEVSFNPSQLLYSPVANVMSLANGGNLQEAAGSRVEVQVTLDDGESCTVAVKRGRNRNIAVSVAGQRLGEKLADIVNPFTVYAPGLAGIAREERYLSPGVVRRIVARGDANLVLRNVLLMLKADNLAWDRFLQDMRSIFRNIDLWVGFNQNTDEYIDASVQLSGTAWLPIDAAGTSVLQASQILAYVALFKPQLLILDEPDSHLHANNQRALCDLICRLSSERGFQTLISTHSRHVLDALKDRSAVIWLSKGETVDEPDINATEVLLDLGALDSIDYFADGGLRCVVATEDTEKAPLKAVLWSNGFVEDDTEVASYAGCSKTDAALVLGRFLKDKARQVAFVVHRDRDYLGANAATKFMDQLGAAGLHPFLTEGSDIEGYFLNAEHLHHLNQTVSAARIQELIDEATTEAKDASLEAIVNQRVQGAFAELRGTGQSPNHGQIAVVATRDYDADPAGLRRGKKVLGRLVGKLQREIGRNPLVFLPSPHLRSTELASIAARVWPPNPEADVDNAPGQPPNA